jgi:DoxX-like family
VQERWFARLYLLKPLVFGVLVVFWISTGLVTLGPGWEIGKSLMREAAVGEMLASTTIIGGSLADILIGIGIAFRRTARIALNAAVALSLAYVALGTILLPRLWADPLGPMWKIWPIIVLLLVALAIREER